MKITKVNNNEPGKYPELDPPEKVPENPLLNPLPEIEHDHEDDPDVAKNPPETAPAEPLPEIIPWEENSRLIGYSERIFQTNIKKGV